MKNQAISVIRQTSRTCISLDYAMNYKRTGAEPIDPYVKKIIDK